MGMCLSLSAVSNATIHAVLADPPLIWKVLAPDDEEAYQTARNAAGSWFTRLFRAKKPAVEIAIPEPFAETDLDKAWHGIHYLLTGTAWGGTFPFNFLLDGGQQIGSVDFGYDGPARAFCSAEVLKINDALSRLDETELKKRFNPPEMMKLEIYPEIWDRQDDDELGYCLDNFAGLQGFIRSAAKNGWGVVISIS